MAYADVTSAIRVVEKMGNLTAQLNYLGLEKGMVFTRDKTMSFGLKLDLVSAARATTDMRIAARDRLIQGIQSALPIGAIVRFYLETRPSTKSSLDRFAPTARGDRSTPLQDMLRANHALLERMRRGRWISDSEAYLTVTLPVPRPRNTPFKGNSAAPFVEKALMLQGRLSRQLTMNGMRAEPMSDQEVWGRIQDYANPSMASAEKPPYQAEFDAGDLAGVRLGRKLKNNPRARQPYVASMRAQVACSDIDLDYDSCFMLGQHRVGMVSFLKPTRSTRIGATDAILGALGGTHSTLMVEFVVVDAPKIRGEINESLTKQETAATDPTMNAGREVVTRIQEGTALVQAMEMGQVLTEMSMHVIIYAKSEDELDDRRERVMAAVNEVGGSMSRVATGGTAIKLFLENAPFSGRRSSYQVPAYYRNAADCIPQVGAWRGSEDGVLPLRARNGSVFSVTPVGLPNAGVVVSSSSGQGKSVTVNMLASGLVNRHDASLTVVDPKKDYTPIFMAQGAMDAIVTVAPGARLPTGERVTINPFDLEPGLPGPDAQKVTYLLDFFRALRINDQSTRRVTLLTSAIRLFYQRFSDQVELGNGDVAMQYNGRGIMTDFANIVPLMNIVGGEPVSPSMKREMIAVSQELRAFTGDTPIGSLTDGPTTINVHSRYLCLDIESLVQQKNQQLLEVGALLTNELVWNRLMRLTGKKVVVMEEAGVAKTVPALVELTNRLFKTGRSLGIIPILVMQEIDDAVAYKGVINNAATRILLASEDSERAQIASIYNLNDAMQRMHASLSGEAGRYREILVLQKSVNNVVDGDVGQLWLSREAYWMSTSVKEEAEYRRDVAAELFGYDEARAALYIAQEEQRAA